jgi:small subunit ribosomal protein S4
MPLTRKCVKYFERRPVPPGMHGRGRRKASDYQVRLLEKQRLRHQYNISEAQMRRAYDDAHRGEGKTGETMVTLLERRLDATVQRAGLARTIYQARQLVAHGHFAVNGVPTNIPSYSLKIGDKVEVRQTRRDRELFKTVKETLKSHQAPDWLSLDAANMSGTVLAMPRRDQMPLDFNEQLVVEYYSR